jgi:CBS domain containing-hemolysin-like protein
VGIVRLSSLVDIDKAAAGIDALMHRHIVRLPANTTLLEACHVLLNDGEDYAIVHHNGDIGLLTMSDIVASLLGKPLR